MYMFIKVVAMDVSSGLRKYETLKYEFEKLMIADIMHPLPIPMTKTAYLEFKNHYRSWALTYKHSPETHTRA